MLSKRSKPPVILPPPVGTILLYAADGISSWRRHLNPRGKPRTPKRSDWVSTFRLLVDSDEGLLTLHALAEAGMRAWECPPREIESLDDAFRDITFRAMAIAALQHFADTADDAIALPESELLQLRGPQEPGRVTGMRRKPGPRPLRTFRARRVKARNRLF